MTERQKLMLSISDHGFGHLAQLSAWLNAPQTTEHFQVILQTSLPESTVRSLITAPFKHLSDTGDPGMSMLDALHVDPNHTYGIYFTHYKNRDHIVTQQRQILEKEKPDVLLTNVSWTPLLAAQSLGIPNFAMSSLNWSDLFHYYCGHYPLGDTITKWIRGAYAQSNGFIKLTPGMLMGHLPGPRLDFTARLGLHRNLNIFKAPKQPSVEPPHTNKPNNESTAWILVSPGGLPLEFPLDSWPRCQSIEWVFTVPETPSSRPDMHTPHSLDLKFIDLMASVDAIITKPGYGIFTEAALHCCPVLYIQRPNWPEQPSLTQWLKQQVPCKAINWQTFKSHRWLPTLEALLSQPRDGTHHQQRQAIAEKTNERITEILTCTEDNKSTKNGEKE